MEEYEAVSFKVYVEYDNTGEVEVRRFGVHSSRVSHFAFVLAEIVKVFPKLSGKSFLVQWIDNDSDKVTVSSDEELILALTEMKSEIKKFYITIKDSVNPSRNDNKSDAVHPFIVCDGCNGRLVGFRYKCICCEDYDLCSSCEQKCMHAEHLMLRIPSPSMFEKSDLQKLLRSLTGFVSHKLKGGRHHSHHRRRHSQDNTAADHCKKRKCDKYESGPESDDVDEFIQKIMFCGKKKKMTRCMYKQLINEFFGHWDPANYQTEAGNSEEPKKKSDEESSYESNHVKYLKTIGKTISTLLDPLGIDVDVEVRSKNDDKNEEEEKVEKESHVEGDKGKSPPASSASSTPPQEKEVRFETPKPTKEMKDKVEEITKILASQKMSESPEKDDWVSFEELKRDANESPKSGESPSQAQASNSSRQAEGEPKPSSSQASADLYPNLNSLRVPGDSKTAESEQSLPMTPTIDDKLLTELLESNNRDILYKVLKVLMSHKKS